MTGPQGAGVFMSGMSVSGHPGGGVSFYDDTILGGGDVIWFSKVAELIEYTEWETIAEAISTNIRAEATLLGGPIYFTAWWEESGEAPATYEDAVDAIGGVIWKSNLDTTTTGSAGDPVGGTITVSGGYRYHTFIFANASIGDNKFYPMNTAGKQVDLFAIAGGGAGGARPSSGPAYTGGGGAGEYVHFPTLTIDENGLLVNVGAQTTAYTATGQAGRNGNSTLISFNGSTQTLLGGRAGGAPAFSSGDGNTGGGSGGGGAAASGVSGAGGAGSTGGTNGGAGAGSATDVDNRAGGGGGAGGSGTSGVAGGQDGDGGPGYEWPVGSGTRYGGGGGGAGGDNGEGGSGGGAAGGVGTPTADTGSGGGGWSSAQAGFGSRGAAGRVALRYPYP